MAVDQNSFICKQPFFAKLLYSFTFANFANLRFSFAGLRLVHFSAAAKNGKRQISLPQRVLRKYLLPTADHQRVVI